MALWARSIAPLPGSRPTLVRNPQREALTSREIGARSLSAAVAVSVVVGCTVAGGAWFLALVMAVTGLATWEVTVLQARAHVLGLLAVGLAASWAFPLAAATHNPTLAWLLLTFAVVGGLIPLALRRPGSPVPTSGPAVRAWDYGLQEWALSIAVGLYAGTLLAPGVLLRQRDDGLAWVALVLAATWFCDTAAFFAGRFWGRHQLSPTVSPQKSIEGVAAGVAAAILITVVATAVVAEPVVRLAGLGVLVGMGATAGDLVESALKRHLGVKDSGWIMPGHGGMLDRIDSLLFATFLGYWYVTLTDGMAPS